MLTGDPGGVKPLDGHLFFGPMRFAILVFAFFAAAKELALAIAGSGFAEELGDARILGGGQRRQEGKLGRIRL